MRDDRTQEQDRVAPGADGEPASAEALRLPVIAARAAADKKADGVIVLDVAAVLAICDAFVIASAGNPRLVRSIADDVEEAVRAAAGRGPLRVEGLDDARWVLMDYGDFVVHVFLAEVRTYYDLERLWADAPRVDWEDESPAVGPAP